MKKGISIIELLIAMAMSGMIFVTVSTLLVTLMTSNTRSRRQEVFEQIKNDVFVELSNSVRWGETVDYSGGELIVDGKTYKLDAERILKNGEPLTPQNVQITKFDIISRTSDPEYESYLIEIEMQDRNFNVNKDNLRMVVSQRKTEVDQ